MRRFGKGLSRSSRAWIRLTLITLASLSINAGIGYGIYYAIKQDSGINYLNWLESHYIEYSYSSDIKNDEFEKKIEAGGLFCVPVNVGDNIRIDRTIAQAYLERITKKYNLVGDKISYEGEDESNFQFTRKSIHKNTKNTEISCWDAEKKSTDHPTITFETKSPYEISISKYIKQYYKIINFHPNYSDLAINMAIRDNSINDKIYCHNYDTYKYNINSQENLDSLSVKQINEENLVPLEEHKKSALDKLNDAFSHTNIKFVESDLSKKDQSEFKRYLYYWQKGIYVRKYVTFNCWDITKDIKLEHFQDRVDKVKDSYINGENKDRRLRNAFLYGVVCYTKKHSNLFSTIKDDTAGSTLSTFLRENFDSREVAFGANFRDTYSKYIGIKTGLEIPIIKIPLTFKKLALYCAGVTF